MIIKKLIIGDYELIDRGDHVIETNLITGEREVRVLTNVPVEELQASEELKAFKKHWQAPVSKDACLPPNFRVVYFGSRPTDVVHSSRGYFLERYYVGPGYMPVCVLLLESAGLKRLDDARS